MGILIEVHNLGPLKSAEIDLGDFNVLVGNNNTGKTFLATVLHRVLASSHGFPLPKRLAVGDVPDQFLDIVEHVIRLFNSDDPESITAILKPNSTTRRWIDSINTELLARFGAAVRNSLAYAYGTDSASLRRRALTRHAPDSYLRICNHNPDTKLDWSVTVRFDSENVEVDTPGAPAWLARILRDENVEFATGYWPLKPEHSEAAIDGLKTTCRRLAFAEGRAALFDLWPREAIHIPSDRTGIVQNYALLISASVRGFAGANGRSAQDVPPTGTAADLLSLMALMASERHASREPSEFALLAHEFEESIGAGIEFETGKNRRVRSSPSHPKDDFRSRGRQRCSPNS